MTHLAFPNRAVLRLSGPDTLSVLERTVTHTVSGWNTGEMRYGALLTPQGKIIADYLAMLWQEDILLDVHADAIGDLEKRLKMFRLRADMTIEQADDLKVVTGDWVDVRSAALPHRQIVASNLVDGEMPPSVWHAQRIAAGIPEWGSDYRAAEVFPTDINMDVMNGIDYKKGCFVGQEVASRMKRRGKIRKRTLVVAGDALEAGANIIATAPVGTITSAEGKLGLALIRTDRMIAAHDDLTCNDQPVTIETPNWLTTEIAAQAAE